MAGTITTNGHNREAEAMLPVITAIGIGNGTDDESIQHTALTGAETYIKDLQTGDKERTGNTNVYTAMVGGTDGNFQISEIGMFYGPSGSRVLYARGRVVPAIDKQSGETITLIARSVYG